MQSVRLLINIKWPPNIKDICLSVHQFVNMTGLAKAFDGFPLMILEALIGKGC
jgi:hypothetical protein